MKIQLKNNAMVGVIGGGPAGSFFSYMLLNLAKEKGIKLNLEIYEGKHFSKSGPTGCNFCAGVISETLIEKMEHIGIIIPDEIAQSKVEGYCMKTSLGEVLLYHPYTKIRIISVFRGNGPLFSNLTKNISFDDLLLKESIKMGAKVIYEIVHDIQFPLEPTDQITLIVGKEKRIVKVDFLIGAFGLNISFMDKIKNAGFGYKPPKVYRTFQTEIKCNSTFIREKFKSFIYIYNLGIQHIRFAAIVPKGEYLTLTIIGEKNINYQEILDFLKNQCIKEIIPRNWHFSTQHCHCFPNIAITSAKKPYTNRFAIIGDASCSRYYKNGIESAFITATIAAKTAINHGISEKDFEKWYWKKTRKLRIDNIFGKLLFHINDNIVKFKLITESHLIIANSTGYASSVLREILWNMFTGNIEYYKIFIKILNPALHITIFISLITAKLIKMKNILAKFIKSLAKYI